MTSSIVLHGGVSKFLHCPTLIFFQFDYSEFMLGEIRSENWVKPFFLIRFWGDGNLCVGRHHIDPTDNCGG